MQGQYLYTHTANGSSATGGAILLTQFEQSAKSQNNRMVTDTNTTIGSSALTQ
jgi:hypothetical protein